MPKHILPFVGPKNQNRNKNRAYPYHAARLQHIHVGPLPPSRKAHHSGGSSCLFRKQGGTSGFIIPSHVLTLCHFCFGENLLAAKTARA